MGKHKIVKSAAAVALVASAVTAVAPGASAASYKVNAKDQLVSSTTGKLVKGWKVFGGKLYKNGKLAPAKKYKIIGTGAAQRLYFGPTLKKGYKTANSKTLLFKDGKLADGYKQAGKNERLYKNGKLDKGYTVYTNVEGDKFLYQNGKLKKGDKTATRGGETLLFTDGLLSKGVKEFNGKTYNNGKLANGLVDGKEYENGVLVSSIDSAKSLNSTTVEVTFKKALDAADVKAADFTIEGLTVSNAVIKQSDAKTVVLTTSTQEAAKEYTVAYAGDTAKFTAINNTIPKVVNLVTDKEYQSAQQQVIGKEVTLKAQVTVEEGQAKAGIPVTFVIDNNKDVTGANSNNQGKDITVEVLTDENGVASYTYTQYVASKDAVTVYPTGAPTQRTGSQVVWGVALPLTVTEATSGNALANDAKKVYSVSSSEYAIEEGTNKKYVNVTFAENYNVTPDKVNKAATVNGEVVFQSSISGEAVSANSVKVYLDDNYKGSFTVTGADTSVTPVVFVDGGDNRLNPAELQVTAPTVAFSNAKTVTLSNVAQGTKNASAAQTVAALEGATELAANQGGRTYVATLTDKDGKVAPAGTKVYLDLTNAGVTDKPATEKPALYVFDAAGKKVAVNNGVAELTTDKDGKVTYVIATTTPNSYVTPVVYLENGITTGLDKNDSRAEGEITYFGDATVAKAEIKFYDGKTEVTSLNGKDTVTVKYQTVDQNGFPYTPNKAGEQGEKVTFNFSTTFGDLKVYDTNDQLLATIPAIGNGGSQQGFIQSIDEKGAITFKLNTNKDTKVSLEASANDDIAQILNATFTFSGISTVGTVYTGKVAALDTAKKEIAFEGKEAISYAGATYKNESGVTIDQATFEATAVAGKTVTYNKDANGNVTFEIVKGETVTPETPGTEDQAAKDAEAAKTVSDAIKALPAAADLTKEDAAKVEDAAKAYDELTAAQKDLVSADDKATLEAAKTKIAELTTEEKGGNTVADLKGEVVELGLPGFLRVDFKIADLEAANLKASENEKLVLEIDGKQVDLVAKGDTLLVAPIEGYDATDDAEKIQTAVVKVVAK